MKTSFFWAGLCGLGQCMPGSPTLAMIIPNRLLTDMAIEDLAEFGRTVKARVYQYTGLHVRVAIAPSKCLTRVACELLKQDERYGDVLDLTVFTEEQLDQGLTHVAIEKVWGIGPKYARFLRNYGIQSARDLKYAEECWIRRCLTVIGARIQAELKGMSCFPLEEKRPPKQQIICAKSFGREISDRLELEEAVATYVARAAEKLREQDSLAGRITVFIVNSLFTLKQARVGLHAIYRKGYCYSGPIVDQAVLHAVLLEIRHLGLPLLDMKCSSSAPDDGLVNSKGEAGTQQE